MSKDLIGNYKERVGDTHQVIETKGGVDDTVWNANSIETEGVRINDPGEGPPVVLRHFFFTAKPGPVKPTKMQLFAENKRLIEATLWGDGLVPREDTKIEIHTSNGAKKVSQALYAKMKQVKADFVIMVLCEAKKGVMINEKPTLAT